MDLFRNEKSELEKIKQERDILKIKLNNIINSDM
jgi:hypothetical protein